MEPESVDGGALFPERSAEKNDKLVDCCSLLGLTQAPVGQGEVVRTRLTRDADNSFLSLTDPFDAASRPYVEHVRVVPSQFGRDDVAVQHDRFRLSGTDAADRQGFKCLTASSRSCHPIRGIGVLPPGLKAHASDHIWAFEELDEMIDRAESERLG